MTALQCPLASGRAPRGGRGKAGARPKGWLPSRRAAARVRRVARAVLARVAVAWAAVWTAPAWAAPQPLSAGNLLQVLLGLILVLALLLAVAWGLRRLTPGHLAAGRFLRVVGGLMVGPKERLVLVEIHETWLLLGVGGGQVRLLHSLPRPEGIEPAAATPPFAALLERALKKRAPERRGPE